MTHANLEVLKFYRELPFNFRQSPGSHLETIRSYNLSQIYPPLDAVLGATRQVLDVGCGVGWLSLAIALHYAKPVTAIDYNDVAIDRAKELASELKVDVRFEVADLFTYEPKQKSDLVTSIGVLHHTNNCHEALRRIMAGFVAPKGCFFVGLYHAYGRKPFLDHFQAMKDKGANDAALLAEYSRLHHWLADKTHLESWFRDQVLHPHETLHTLAEIVEIADACDFDLVSTSINRFEPIRSIAEVLTMEPAYFDRGQKALSDGNYFPGLFIAMLKNRR